MFAVIKTGGKQYKVAAADEVLIEKLETEPGGTVTFEDVLMLSDGESVTVGAPVVDGAAVKAEVLKQTKGPKVINFKKRRRKHSSQRRKGHRQKLTMVRVTEILGPGGAALAAAIAAEPAPAPAVEPAPAPAAETETKSED